MSDYLVAAENVSKLFPTPDGSLEILRDLSLSLESGQSMAITGPSGCGKSTLLSLIGGLDTPTSGSVRVAGIDLAALDEVERSRFRNQTVGFVFQDHHLLPQCTVIENVLIPVLASRTAAKTDRDRAAELMNRLGIGDRMQHLPSEISGGERQRAAICRALINEPKLILADEPTGNLDPSSATTVGDLLLELGDSVQAGLICVTHSMELADRFPRHVRLSEGQIVSSK